MNYIYFYKYYGNDIVYAMIYVNNMGTFLYISH